MTFGLVTQKWLSSQLKQLEDKIMGQFEDLNTAIDTLSTDLTTEFANLTTEITNLKNAGGATPAQLQSLIDKVSAIDMTVKNFSA